MKPIYPNSLEDRKLIFKSVKSGKILDVGCAKGEILKQLKNQNNELFGFDILDQIPDKDINFKNCNFNYFFNNNTIKFDTIILSSVLHELYSYDNNKIVKKQFFLNVIDVLKKHLAPGGVIIIRDGIRQNKQEINVKFKENILDYFYLFNASRNLPFKYDSKLNRLIASEETIYEFIMSYTWKYSSLNIFKREINEDFGIFNETDFLELSDDLIIKRHEKYFRDTYLNYFKKFLEDPYIFKNTHQILVLEKR